MDTTSSPADFSSHLVLTAGLEEDSQSEADHLCESCSMCWDDIFSIWAPEDSEEEEHDPNTVFDFHGMKARRASQHAIKRSHTAFARRRRTTKRDISRTNHSQEPIGSRNDIWREGLEKGAFVTYNRRRCRCDYCMQLATLAQERRTLRWAVRRAEQGKDWRGRMFTASKKPRWVDYDWDVECGDGGAGEHWDGAESVFEPERVPPMEGCLSELTRIRRPQSRKAVQSKLLPYTCRGMKGSLSATESDLSIESNSSTSGSGPSRCDDDWEVLSLYSEWDQCSVRSL
jgi:hypothetical protein